MEGGLKKSFLFNLIIVLVLCAGLYALFFLSLGLLTHHGEEVKVPKIIGQDLKVALAQLTKEGFDVQIDSAYEPDQKPFVVLGQQPEVGAVVKHGRTLFLTVNKAEPLKTAMPNLIGLSYRSAVLILKSNRLVLGDTSYKPDIAKGAILEQSMNGQVIRPGQIISQGSVISLVIGDGLGETEMNVPDLIGISYDEAMATLSASGLKGEAVWQGEITDSGSAVIYDQQPHATNDMMAPNRIREGDAIGIYIKQSPTDDEIQNNRRGGSAVSNSTNSTDTAKKTP
ncbi:PASTA domain-containing protein [Taibaiella soli]|uniref:Penicillin-binding protein n=1 Tax=Taibaiella soli TaxID=1649169 RepID=A0A2W2BBS1_9BACT|nr:PASTA domain-containing protein [Taibaiella soli]PZF71106.1 penicillin-binding protein [Taibaiella soli]